jgi:hypothetical protein
MGYVILEHLVSVVAVLVFASFVFVISLVLMVAREGFAHVFGANARLAGRLRKLS